MKLYLMLTFCLLAALVAGCNRGTKKNDYRHLVNSELINAYNNVAIENAIISQHTIYPYYFVNNGVELNELGDKDLQILANHFMENPGKLNIRRGDTESNVYDARVQSVIARLKQMGVDETKISISDGMPGGSGISSEKVLMILEKENKTSRRISGSFKR